MFAACPAQGGGITRATSLFEEQHQATSQEQQTHEPHERHLGKLGMQTPTQVQSSAHNRQCGQEIHEDLLAQKTQDGVGCQSDPTVDEKVRGKGGTKDVLVQVSKIQIDSIKRAASAE